MFNDRKKEFQAVARAWDAAVQATLRPIRMKPMRSWRAISEAGLRIPPSSPKASSGIAIVQCRQNREYFGTPDEPGPIYQTMQHAIDVWSELGVLKVKVTPADVIAHGILDE